MKTAFALVTKMFKFNQTAPLVKSILLEGCNTLSEEAVVNKYLASHYLSQFRAEAYEDKEQPPAPEY
jgi:hypothetical protein